jgi:hypothetical protein
MLAILDAIVIPFAGVQLRRVDSFIPVLQTVMCAVDLLTAALLFAQYSIQPLRAIILVASGYVFSGLFAFIQTLAFPGAYSPTGVIGERYLITSGGKNCPVDWQPIGRASQHGHAYGNVS